MGSPMIFSNGFLFAAGLISRSAIPYSHRSVFADGRVNRIRFAPLDRSFSLVAIRAHRRPRSAMMFEARVLMNVVTRDARRKLRTVDRHVSSILIDVPVAGIQTRVVRL